MSFFWFLIWTCLFNSFQFDQDFTGPWGTTVYHRPTRLRICGAVLFRLLFIFVGEWTALQWSRSQDPTMSYDVWMFGSSDQLFQMVSRYFKQLFKPFKHPFVNFTTLYSFGIFGARGKPTCQHSFLEIQPAEVHDACDVLHALCLWHLPGSPECLANALRMPCWIFDPFPFDPMLCLLQSTVSGRCTPESKHWQPTRRMRSPKKSAGSH